MSKDCGGKEGKIAKAIEKRGMPKGKAIAIAKSKAGKKGKR